MEFAALLGVLLVLYLLLAPLVALLRSGRAVQQTEHLHDTQRAQHGALAELRSQILQLREQQRALALQLAQLERQLTQVPPAAVATDQHQAASAPAATVVEPAVPDAPAEHGDEPAAPVEQALFESLAQVLPPLPPVAAVVPAVAQPPEVVIPPSAPRPAPSNTSPAVVPPAPIAARIPAVATAAAYGQSAAGSAPVRPPPQAAAATEWPDPEAPSALQLWLAKAFKAGRDWLFGGNLVARIGLIILFIGVAFLLRLAAAHVTVPIELRLAAVAVGAIALLLWGWKITPGRRGIGLPVQGAALAILMLVVFGAYKLWELLPTLPTFALLLALVAFTCVLAVLQNAVWLAVFGIIGGFAVPIALASGDGNHSVLFAYYALLNGGILAIALLRSWRMLNVLGFLFTFVIGTAWGVQRYVPEHYASAQGFLILFTLFYIAIAVFYAWRQAPRLRSYVDGTLVFGVPMVAMGLQFGLVRHIEYGMAFSALALALLYAALGLLLWRVRREGLRLLVECFLALAVVFGTLAIPLAFDGRWTSAVWALEGAGLVWVGLRQQQALTWRFGLLVQVCSWVALLYSFGGVPLQDLLLHDPALRFGLLGISAAGVALWLRRASMAGAAGTAAGMQLASVFFLVAVGWLLAAAWVDVWLRLEDGLRAGMLVLTAMALMLGLQLLGKRIDWKVPELLAAAVAVLAGGTFLLLTLAYMQWQDTGFRSHASLGQLLADGPLFGGLLLCMGALATAFSFKRRAQLLEEQVVDASGMRSAAAWWWLLATFWWCGFALNGLAHALAWLSQSNPGSVAPWYATSFAAFYLVGLAISAAGWTWVAQRFGFPGRQRVVRLFWPGLTLLALALFIVLVHPQLGVYRTLAFDHVLPASATPAWQLLLGGPFSGALLLCGLLVLGLRHSSMLAASDVVARDAGQLLRPLQQVWLLGLLLATVLVVDALALCSARLFDAWPLGYAQAQLLWAGALAMLFTHLAVRPSLVELRLLAVPAVVLQALASLLVLSSLYQHGQLPQGSVWLALLGVWLAVDWCVRKATRAGTAPDAVVLLGLHWGRVIAPVLMLPMVVSLLGRRWLSAAADPVTSPFARWDMAASWPDWLGLWCLLGVLLLLLWQARGAGWPLRPLQQTYLRVLLPLASAVLVLLLACWNIAQDGHMAPLPYLPLLNPLDLSSVLVGVFGLLTWRANAAVADPQLRQWVRRAAAVAAYGWFNLMLLRSAAHYLQLPYQFDALYASQFVQAMLSLVWTVSAFLLMRHAVKRLSKPLWMVGAALLAVVVLKLFMADLAGVGSVARIVSFMGVGGCMLLIGYLAPLPRSVAQQAEAEAPGTST